MTPGYPMTASDLDQHRKEMASMERAFKKIMRSKKSAREFLIKAGILDQTGERLAKRYR